MLRVSQGGHATSRLVQNEVELVPELDRSPVEVELQGQGAVRDLHIATRGEQPAGLGTRATEVAGQESVELVHPDHVYFLLVPPW